MPVRDYIPADAEMTDEEQETFAPTSRPAQLRVRPDYVPEEATPEDVSGDTKRATAEEAADRRAVRSREKEVKHAQGVLARLSTRDAVAHIERLSPMMREVFIRAEATSENPRDDVLDRFPEYRAVAEDAVARAESRPHEPGPSDAAAAKAFAASVAPSARKAKE